MVGRASKAPRRGEVREAVLHAATKLFAASGYGGTPIQAICDEVGITKAALLYHYPSKEQLHAAVLEALLGHWKSLLPRLMQAAVDGEEMFAVTMKEVVAFFLADPNRARLLMREALDREEDMKALVQTHMGPWAEVAAAYVRRGQEMGRVRTSVDPEAYLVSVAASVVGCVAAGQVAQVLSPATDGAQRAVEQSVRSARHALFVDSYTGDRSVG